MLMPRMIAITVSCVSSDVECVYLCWYVSVQYIDSGTLAANRISRRAVAPRERIRYRKQPPANSEAYMGITTASSQCGILTQIAKAVMASQSVSRDSTRFICRVTITSHVSA